MQRRTFSENTFLGVSNSVEELKQFTITELANERTESEQEIAALDTDLRSFTTTKFNESKTHSDQQDISQSATLTQLINDENAAQSASLLSQMDIKDEAVKTFARNRANHTGTQLASTISDFSARVTQEYASGNNPRILIDFDADNRAKLSCHRTGGMVFDINNNTSFTLHQSLYSPLFHEITTDRLRYITISAGQNLSFMTETGGLIMRLEDFQGGDASDGENNSLIEIFTAIDMNDYKISNIGDLTTKGVGYTSADAFNDFYNSLTTAQKQTAILPQSEVQSLIDTSSIADRSRSNHTGTQLASTISDFQASVALNPDLVDATSKKHTHANKVILDATQESFTTALKTKLDSAAIIDDSAASATTTFSSNKVNSNINVNVTNTRNFAIQRSNHTGTQLAATISDFQTSVSLNTDLVDATSKKHTHANKAILDLIEEPFTTVQKNKLESVLTADDLATNSLNDRNRTNHTGTQLASTISDFQSAVSTNTDVADATLKKHIHGNKAILDSVTFALTAQDKLKIDNATMVYDAGAYPDSTYSSQKIEQLLSAKIDSTLVYLKTEIDNLLALKQQLLVSGTNIKTINGNSLLGGGDIAISGGSSKSSVFGFGEQVFTTVNSTGPPVGIPLYGTSTGFNYGGQLIMFHFRPETTCIANIMLCHISSKGSLQHTIQLGVYQSSVNSSTRVISLNLKFFYSIPHSSISAGANYFGSPIIQSGMDNTITAGVDYYLGLYSPTALPAGQMHSLRSLYSGMSMLSFNYCHPMGIGSGFYAQPPANIPTSYSITASSSNTILNNYPYFRFFDSNPTL